MDVGGRGSEGGRAYAVWRREGVRPEGGGGSTVSKREGVRRRWRSLQQGGRREGMERSPLDTRSRASVRGWRFYAYPSYASERSQNAFGLCGRVS